MLATEIRPAAASAAVPAALAALAAAGLPDASSPVGGYLVTRLAALGPDRAAVRWQPPGAAAGCPARAGSGLARCREALHAAGCGCYFVLAPGGWFLAVLAPSPAGDDQR